MIFFFIFILLIVFFNFFFFSSRRRHTRWNCDWSSDVCSSDLPAPRRLLRPRRDPGGPPPPRRRPPHPHRRRAAPQRLPAVGVRVRRAPLHRPLLARFRGRGPGGGGPRIPQAAAPLRRAARDCGGMNAMSEKTRLGLEIL